MYLVLLVCVLFISLMRSVNGTKLLNATSLLLLFGSTAGGGTGAIDIVLLTVYMHHYDHISLTVTLKF